MSRKFFKGSALAAPLPAMLITCRSPEGRDNIMTAAWTGIVNTRPPMAYVSVRPERFSCGIIRERGEFVMNLTTSKMAWETDFCGMKSGSKTDKAKKCKFTLLPAETVDCAVIGQSPAALECKVTREIELGSHIMFIADITGVTVDERYIDSKGKINFGQAGLMAYSHGEYFALGRKLGDFGFSVRKKPKKSHENKKKQG
ncbi:MAG: flavin reductase family protein [Oscillospiraceae bacterium]|nr:flavin reductase family protein [Oscillospiraceae bacterium]